MQAFARRISLTNFRSYRKADFKLGHRTVVVGQNAAGKTNLLEAIYLLSATKSFRADREREMVRWGETAARVALELDLDKETHQLVCQLAAGERTVKKTFNLDGTKQKAAEVVRTFPTALFSGDDVRLIDGSPGRRRRALDLVVGQGSPIYLEAIRRYARVLASRNRLLEQISGGEAGVDELDFWDTELIAAGEVVLAERERFIAAANRALPELYQGIAERTPVELSVAYEPLARDLAAEIPKRRQQDISVGTTTVGPHRDDWKLILGNRPIVSFGSGGEFRSAVLAFRMAEALWLRTELDITPALLLDDVFSELDEHRREALLVNLPDSQTIITTPQADVLPTKFAKAANLIEIGPEQKHV